ncbi:MAG: sulfatase-like hydrolase/transferase [Pirellulales bacterium]
MLRIIFKFQSRIRIILFILTATCICNCEITFAAKRPNVLFLLSDDQRPDTIAALGNPVIKTPNLDALAKRGVSFTRAVCANPICTPSRAEIMTGCSGFRNDVLDFGKPINTGLTTWATAMKQAGYHTWYVGKWHNNGRPTDHGYEETLGLYSGGGGRWAKPTQDWKGQQITGYRGWVFQDDQKKMYPEKGVGLTADISSKFADAAIEFIQRKPKRPFFLHVNFTAPHDPLLRPFDEQHQYTVDQIPLPLNYLPQHPFDHGNFDGRDERLLPFPRTKKIVRQTLAVYYAVISDMDAQVGRIIESLKATGQLENTLVIYSSDHGLGVGSHGIRGKQNMYEHTINVPLIFAGPGVSQNQTTTAQVYLRELYPTVCDLTGIMIPETVEGKSFVGVLTDTSKQHHTQIYGYFRNKQRMIRTDQWKLVWYPEIDRTQLFDMITDRFETKDLAGEDSMADIVMKLRERLKAWQNSVEDEVE